MSFLDRVTVGFNPRAFLIGAYYQYGLFGINLTFFFIEIETDPETVRSLTKTMKSIAADMPDYK